MKIKNADLPAMPIPLQNGSVFNYHGPADGFTKREYFAGLAMQGLLVGSQIDRRSAARHAVEIADKLLAELEKTNE